MLLCEQPGRTGVYATATPERLCLYELSPRGAPAASAPAAALSLSYSLSLSPSPSLSPSHSLSHSLSLSAAASGPGGSRHWGPALRPLVVVPLAPPGGRGGAARAPLALSLSCAAGDAVRFFVSDAAGGAWTGAAADGAARALRTGDFDAAFGGRAAVTASGWDPRSAAALAIGRRDGVVQLLDVDVESGGSATGKAAAAAAPAVAEVVQERALRGRVMDLDWVPLSHTMVVAARRGGDVGCYAELMDLRSPESGIRYLGAPQAHSGGGSFFYDSCYAERVACETSQTYVAVAGSHGRRDIVQLWDLRLTSRPLQWHICSRAGCTSLRWSPCEPMTVVAATQNGRLRLYSFTSRGEDVDDDDGSDEADTDDDRYKKRCGRGFYSLKTKNGGTSLGSGVVSRSYTNGGSWLYARVPAAGVAWWTDNSAKAEDNAKKGPPVAMGLRTDMPRLLLLNAKTGLLHSQVFSRMGSTVTMAGDIALCGAGPNVLLVPYVTGTHTDSRMNMQLQEKTDVFSGPSTLRGLRASGINASVAGMEDTSGEDLTGLIGSSFRVNTERAPLSPPRLIATGPGIHAEASRSALYPLDRTIRRRERLRQGFLPQQQKPLTVLTEEGIDSEACALFRYGWLLQRLQHPERQAMPATDIVPGLIELLQRDELAFPEEKEPRQLQAGRSHGMFCMRAFILQAMGWCVDRSDDCFPSSASPTSPVPTGTDDGLDAIPASPVSQVDVADILMQQQLPPPQLEPTDRVGTVSQQEAVERRAALLTCMGQSREAAAMLARHGTLSVLHPTLAIQLLVESASASSSNVTQGNTLFDNSLADSTEAVCTHWMDLCFFLAKSLGAAPMPLLPARSELFADTMKRFQRFLPLADQIALAAALLLPPQGTTPTKEERVALIDVLRDMVQQQFRPNGSGASILLAAAVEGIDRECTSLQRYIDETGDLQTPICYVALYGPAGRSVWRGWNDAYCAQLNAEGESILRSMHDLAYTKTIRLRESANSPAPHLGSAALRQPHSLLGVPFGGLAPGGDAVKAKPPNRDGRLGVELLCSCGQPMHTRAAAIKGNSRDAGSRQHTRCGNPKCRAGQTPVCVVCSEWLDKRSGDGAVDKYFAWCTVCLHGGHWAHLRDWFEKHRSCPVEDCLCQCMYDRGS